jgi:hypothetical protein
MIYDYICFALRFFQLILDLVVYFLVYNNIYVVNFHELITLFSSISIDKNLLALLENIRAIAGY